MNEDETATNAEEPGISRRTLVAGTAWAVPAVMIAASAPTSAASVTCTGSFCLVGDFCKLPGESADGCDRRPCSKGYRAVATITASPIVRVLCYKVTAQGDTTTDIRICGGTTCTGTCNANIVCLPGYQSKCIPASTGATQFTVDVCGFRNSRDTTITIDYFLYRCDTGALIETAATSGGAHPC